MEPTNKNRFFDFFKDQTEEKANIDRQVEQTPLNEDQILNLLVNDGKVDEDGRWLGFYFLTEARLEDVDDQEKQLNSIELALKLIAIREIEFKKATEYLENVNVRAVSENLSPVTLGPFACSYLSPKLFDFLWQKYFLIPFSFSSFPSLFPHWFYPEGNRKEETLQDAKIISGQSPDPTFTIDCFQVFYGAEAISSGNKTTIPQILIDLATKTLRFLPHIEITEKEIAKCFVYQTLFGFHFSKEVHSFIQKKPENLTAAIEKELTALGKNTPESFDLTMMNAAFFYEDLSFFPKKAVNFSPEDSLSFQKIKDILPLFFIDYRNAFFLHDKKKKLIQVPLFNNLYGDYGFFSLSFSLQKEKEKFSSLSKEEWDSFSPWIHQGFLYASKKSSLSFSSEEIQEIENVRDFLLEKKFCSCVILGYRLSFFLLQKDPSNQNFTKLFTFYSGLSKDHKHESLDDLLDLKQKEGSLDFFESLFLDSDPTTSACAKDRLKEIVKKEEVLPLFQRLVQKNSEKALSFIFSKQNSPRHEEFCLEPCLYSSSFFEAFSFMAKIEASVPLPYLKMILTQLKKNQYLKVEDAVPLFWWMHLGMKNNNQKEVIALLDKLPEKQKQQFQKFYPAFLSEEEKQKTIQKWKQEGKIPEEIKNDSFSIESYLSSIQDLALKAWFLLQTEKSLADLLEKDPKELMKLPEQTKQNIMEGYVEKNGLTCFLSQIKQIKEKDPQVFESIIFCFLGSNHPFKDQVFTFFLENPSFLRKNSAEKFYQFIPSFSDFSKENLLKVLISPAFFLKIKVTPITEWVPQDILENFLEKEIDHLENAFSLFLLNPFPLKNSKDKVMSWLIQEKKVKKAVQWMETRTLTFQELSDDFLAFLKKENPDIILKTISRIKPSEKEISFFLSYLENASFSSLPPISFSLVQAFLENENIKTWISKLLEKHNLDKKSVIKFLLSLFQTEKEVWKRYPDFTFSFLTEELKKSPFQFFNFLLSADDSFEKLFPFLLPLFSNEKNDNLLLVIGKIKNSSFFESAQNTLILSLLKSSSPCLFNEGLSFLFSLNLEEKFKEECFNQLTCKLKEKHLESIFIDCIQKNSLDKKVVFHSFFDCLSEESQSKLLDWILPIWKESIQKNELEFLKDSLCTAISSIQTKKPFINIVHVLISKEFSYLKEEKVFSILLDKYIELAKKDISFIEKEKNNLFLLFQVHCDKLSFEKLKQFFSLSFSSKVFENKTLSDIWGNTLLKLSESTFEKKEIASEREILNLESFFKLLFSCSAFDADCKKDIGYSLLFYIKNFLDKQNEIVSFLPLLEKLILTIPYQVYAHMKSHISWEKHQTTFSSTKEGILLSLFFEFNVTSSSFAALQEKDQEDLQNTWFNYCLYSGECASEITTGILFIKFYKVHSSKTKKSYFSLCKKLLEKDLRKKEVSLIVSNFFQDFSKNTPLSLKENKEVMSLFFNKALEFLNETKEDREKKIFIGNSFFNLLSSAIFCNWIDQSIYPYVEPILREAIQETLSQSYTNESMLFENSFISLLNRTFSLIEKLNQIFPGLKKEDIDKIFYFFFEALFYFDNYQVWKSKDIEIIYFIKGRLLLLAPKILKHLQLLKKQNSFSIHETTETFITNLVDEFIREGTTVL